VVDHRIANSGGTDPLGARVDHEVAAAQEADQRQAELARKLGMTSRASSKDGAAGQPAKRLFATNQTLAGRSARRRIYQGNQNSP
jgi:hypothetical protein